jgi:hypothetical protein
MAAKTKIDYALIEDDWRAGIKTKLQMSEEHHVSRAAMDKHFKKLNIQRDLSERIKQRAQAMVTQAMVTQQVTPATSATTTKESEIIEINAAYQAGVLISHRKDITWFRAMLLKLIREVETETDDPEAFADLAELIIWKPSEGQQVQTKAEFDRMVRLQELFNRVMSSPTRIDSMRKLAETLKTLIGLERQAIGLKEVDLPKPGSDVPEGTITRIERVIIDHRRTETVESITVVQPEKAA